MDGALQALLKFAGIPDAVVNDIATIIPEFPDVVNFAKQIAEVANTKQTLPEHIKQLAPIIQAAWPTIDHVLPQVEDIVQYVTNKPTNPTP